MWQTRSIWVRAIICWLIGLAFLFSGESTNHDVRLRLRGTVQRPQETVLLLISRPEWLTVRSSEDDLVRPIKEVTNVTDSYFWHEATWFQMLNQLLTLDPKAIGVSFFFGESIPLSENFLNRKKVFLDSRIIWPAKLETGSGVQFPVFANNYARNVGLVNLPPDSDGIVRRYSNTILQVSQFGLKVAQKINIGTRLPIDTRNPLIDFQGPSGTFRTVSLIDLMRGRVPNSLIKNKIVIIGSKDAMDHQVLTPVGPMTKAETLANMTDTALHSRWIQELPDITYAIALLFVLMFNLWLIFSYPQFVAFVFLVCFGAILICLSIWAFDSHYLWTPILAPLAQSFITFIIFQSYQLGLKERRTRELEQDQRLLMEMEQLKNNFISLVSHDLKNPIAKIQAIVDRLLRGSIADGLKEDLHSLRSCSDDLHRYIQSVLQVSRIEARDLRLRLEPADINDLIQKVCSSLTPLFQEKALTLEIKQEPLFSIELDVGLIQEVILNLVENAIKYTPSNGKIIVESKETSNEVIVTVTDTGPGISKAEKEVVWAKFYRGRQHEMNTKGTGLGLYLVKYFVELHHGSVFLDTETDKGTAIGFRLPVETSIENDSRSTPESHEHETPDIQPT